ncbi:hypothetical protein COCNU_scaffold002139G000040 [Cocos nucifera]|nr:hypothetical protein [Cocos nucifera]
MGGQMPMTTRRKEMVGGKASTKETATTVGSKATADGKEGREDGPREAAREANPGARGLHKRCYDGHVMAGEEKAPVGCNKAERRGHYGTEKMAESCSGSRKGGSTN